MICLTDDEYDTLVGKLEDAYDQNHDHIESRLNGIEVMVGLYQQITDLKGQVAEYKEAYDDLYKKYWKLRRETDAIFTAHV